MSDFSQMLPVGTVIDGRYRIERYLASGGFGNTYEATDMKLGCHVAVKEFFLSQHSMRAADRCGVTVTSHTGRELFDHYREKFKTEAQRISQLRSNHIVRVSDLMEANGTVYYVMDFIDGVSLKTRIQGGQPLPADEAVGICRQMLSALAVIHQAGLYHLDVKPSNIMLTNDGNAVLIDFGASKQVDAAGGITQHSQMVFSPGYAPSEQLDGKADRVGPWTDFYALGATLYTMLTALAPPTPSLITDDGDEAFQFSTSVPDSLQKAVLTLMRQSTKRRPQTIDAVRQLLDSTPAEDVVEVALADDSATRIQPAAAASAPASTPTPARRPVGPQKDRSFTVKGVEFTMVAVEGGRFMMGATPELEDEAAGREKPAHQVTLDGFLIGQTQVTQALWRAVMGDNPSDNKGDNLPVESVNWNECQRFITKLNQATGEHFRLPTEAEWEFAARGGNKSRHTKYAGSNDIDAVAWYEGNSNTSSSWWGKTFSGGKSQPVAQKAPNELDIYDMSGNVWEWCQDWYDENYYNQSPSENPCNDTEGSCRVIRGGSFNNYDRLCRVAGRSGRGSGIIDNYLGFRLAL